MMEHPPCRRYDGDTAKAEGEYSEGPGHAESLAPIIARLDLDGSLLLRALAAKLTAKACRSRGAEFGLP